MRVCGQGKFGPWRSPERASTSYVRCINQAVNYLLTRRGASQQQAKKVGLGLRLQCVEMIKHDLKSVRPDAAGRAVCAIALRQLAYRAVKLAGSLAGGGESTGRQEGSGVGCCCICLDDVEEGGDGVALPCKHVYHQVRGKQARVMGGGGGGGGRKGRERERGARRHGERQRDDKREPGRETAKRSEQCSAVHAPAIQLSVYLW